MTVLQAMYLGPVGLVLVLTTISVVYVLAGRHQSITKRILKSSHGIVFLCAMYWPIAARHFSIFCYAEWPGYAFVAFVVLGIMATAYSLYGYTRYWHLHFLHIFTFLYGSLATLYGMHALTHICE